MNNSPLGVERAPVAFAPLNGSVPVTVQSGFQTVAVLSRTSTR